MHVFIELWTPKPSWSQLPRAARDELMQRMGELTSPIIEREKIEVLGWGFADPDIDRREPHKYFAVWRAPRPESLTELLSAIAKGGWYTHFEQVNVVGRLDAPDAIITHHLEHGA